MQSKHGPALDVLEEVLTEVEQRKRANQQQPVSESTIPGSMAQAMPQLVVQAANTINPVVSTTTFKESAQPGSLEQGLVDGMPGAQVIEHEVSPEIPVEVESYIERVEETGHLPQQITLAGDQIELTPMQPAPKQTVVVLPITPQDEKEGARKSPRFSLRWLPVKLFIGRVNVRT